MVEARQRSAEDDAVGFQGPVERVPEEQRPCALARGREYVGVVLLHQILDEVGPCADGVPQA